MTILAILAATLTLGTWFGIRWAEESRRLDLTTYLLSIPADEWGDK